MPSPKIRKKPTNKRCEKGFPCKTTCISRAKNCRKPLKWQAETFALWLKAQEERLAITNQKRERAGLAPAQLTEHGYIAADRARVSPPENKAAIASPVPGSKTVGKSRKAKGLSDVIKQEVARPPSSLEKEVMAENKAIAAKKEKPKPIEQAVVTEVAGKKNSQAIASPSQMILSEDELSSMVNYAGQSGQLRAILSNPDLVEGMRNTLKGMKENDKRRGEFASAIKIGEAIEKYEAMPNSKEKEQLGDSINQAFAGIDNLLSRKQEREVSELQKTIKQSRTKKRDLANLEPWEMTREEYIALRKIQGSRSSRLDGMTHGNIVARALGEGMDVPSYVKSRYPNVEDHPQYKSAYEERTGQKPPANTNKDKASSKERKAKMKAFGDVVFGDGPDSFRTQVSESISQAIADSPPLKRDSKTVLKEMEINEKESDLIGDKLHKKSREIDDAEKKLEAMNKALPVATGKNRNATKKEYQLTGRDTIPELKPAFSTAQKNKQKKEIEALRSQYQELEKEWFASKRKDATLRDEYDDLSRRESMAAFSSPTAIAD